jgi:hypothetical protein
LQIQGVSTFFSIFEWPMMVKLGKYCSDQPLLKLEIFGAGLRGRTSNTGDSMIEDLNIKT